MSVGLSVRLSLCPSVTLVSHTYTVEDIARAIRQSDVSSFLRQKLHVLEFRGSLEREC